MREDVLAAVGRWSFIPHNALRVETDEYQVLRLPDWWEQPLELRWLRPVRALDVVLDEILTGCAQSGLPHVACWVRLGAPPAIETAFRARGGQLDETLDVLARSLEDGGPDLAPPADVEIRWATDVTTFGHAMRLGSVVFNGDDTLDEAVVAEEFAGEQGKMERGEGGGVVAYLDGVPVGTAGLTMAGRDARLWGGGVLEEARGKGVYRALLDARLRYAVEYGGELALVKGRVQTSGPILRRAGFEVFGQERSYLVPLPSELNDQPADQ